MSRGMTIADFVQQVLYAVYKVRLDVDESKEGSFHSKSDKFKEVVMEANFVLQEFQKEADWNFLRERWEIGPARNGRFGLPQEVKIPDGAYKLCTGYGDAVRLHKGPVTYQIPFEEARTSNRRYVDMFDGCGRLNAPETGQRATFVGDTLTFNHPWHPGELGGFLETDVVSYIEPLHICGDDCPDHCPKAYDDVMFKWMPDPYYLVARTAAKRAYADPSCSDMIQPLTDEATRLLSAIRENDSAHTTPDTYETCALGYVSVL
jgi:hypothetical protein